MSIHQLKTAAVHAFRGAADLVRTTRSVVALIAAVSIVAGCANPSPAPVEERPAVKSARTGAPGAAAAASTVTGRPATYTVRRGDTLYQIALDSGLDYRELAAWNHVENVDRIFVGQVLRLSPSGQASAAVGTSPPALADAAGVGTSTPTLTSATAGAADSEVSPGVTVTPLRAEPAIVASTTQTGGARPMTPGAPAAATGAVAAAPVQGAGAAASATGRLETEPKAVKLPYSDGAVRELNLAASSVPAPTQSPSAPAAAAPSQAPSTAKADATSQAPARVANAAPTRGPTSSSSSNATGSDDQLGWVWPAKGKVVAQFSDSSTLKGIDIAGAMGEPVYASAAGKVVYAGSGLRGYGKLIIIKHNAMYLSAYAHNSAILVKEGQQVTRGQEIAQMGKTDSDRVKLHFEIRRYGKPMDPEKYLPPA